MSGRPPTTEHGLAMYKRGCKCEVCMDANRIASARKRRRLKGLEPPTHGLSAYKNYGCRCEVCKKASVDRRAVWYEANREEILARKKAREQRAREARNGNGS